jgi:hypothetical protein
MREVALQTKKANNFFSSPSSPINIVGLTFATALLQSLCYSFVPDISTKPRFHKIEILFLTFLPSPRCPFPKQNRNT